MFRSQGSEEALIIGRVLSGEREVFGLLVARHLPAVYAVAYAHTHNHADAEDVAQDAFLSALQSLDRLRDPRKFVSWTLSIARRGAIDAFRAKGRLSESEPPERGEDPRPEVDRRELFALVERHLADLDEASREVLLLHYFAGLNGREIGQMLGVSHGAVRKRLERARETLGESLLREVGTARDVKSMLAQPVERISCAALAAPVAWKAGAAVALGTTGGGLAVLAKAAVTLAVVVASGVVAWTHLDRPGATPSSLAAPVVPPVPEASTKGVPSKATAAQSSESKSPALAAGQAATDEPRPQVLVRARKDSGGYAEPGSIRLHRVDPDSADAAAADAAELQRIVQTTTNRRPPIVPKVDLAETGPAVFSGLPPGRYIAFWIDGSRELVSASAPIPFDLKSSSAPIELTLEVTEGGVITGRVTDVATGRPLEGVEVHAYNANGYGPSPAESGRTDVEGKYRIRGFCKGTFVVEPLQNLGFVRIPGADKLQTDATPGKTSEGLDFVVRTTPSIRGRVLDPKGQPAVGVPVRAIAPYREGKQAYAHGETKSDGTFEMRGIEPTDGLYVGGGSSSPGNQMSIVPLGPLTLTDAGLRDVVLRAQEPAEVSGVVVDSEGKPVAGAMVGLWSSQYEQWDFRVNSDDAGMFVFKNAYAGAFYLTAFVPSNPERKAVSLRSKDRVDIEVRAGDKKTGLKLLLPSSGMTLSGTVRDAAGKPLEGIFVTAREMHDHSDVGQPERYPTDREGRYLVPGLPSGSFFVYVRDDSERFKPVSRESVAAGSTDVDFVVQEACFIEGRVVALDSGRPVTDFNIGMALQREESILLRRHFGSERNVKDEEGRFKIPLDFEGKKDITVAARGPGFGAQMVVIPGVTAEKGVGDVVLKLPRSATVKGTVFDPDGASKMEVRILEGDIALVLRVSEPLALTGADGTFEVRDLSPGPQVLTAYSPDAPPERVEVNPKAGETQTVEVHLKRGAVLEGDVTRGGSALGGDETFLLRVNYEPETEGRDWDFVGLRGTSRYSFKHPLMPGQVWISAELHQGHNTVGYVKRAVELRDGEPSKVDLDFPGGSCVLEGTVVLPAGVSRYMLELEVPVEGGKATAVRWGEPGTCRFEDLPAGSGEARIRAWLPDSTELVRTVPVQLAVGVPCRVDVDLR